MQALHLIRPSCTPLPKRSTRHTRVQCCSSDAAAPRRCPDGLRVLLAQKFPNTLLLDGQQLPRLHSSKHFINLTNGLELAPILHQLYLPHSAVRIRSTNLEQQSFEALMLELDANLLVSMALGHSCIVWDCGCRNKDNGAPRAIWYGLEFIRFALNRFWTGRAEPAHLRGYNVTDSFEASCRRFHPSTKKRLRYYKRYLAETVQQSGVSLYGVFKRTERDEDVGFFVDKAVHYLGVAEFADSPLASSSVQGVGGVSKMQSSCASAPAVVCSPMQKGVNCSINSVCSANDIAVYNSLVLQGLGMFAAGLSHPQYKVLQLIQPGVHQQQ